MKLTLHARFLILILSALFLVSCTSAREAYLRSHPDIPSWVKESYLKGIPATGMSEEMIRSLLGSPKRIETDTASAGVTWKWGRIRNWSDTEDRAYRGFVAERIVRFQKGLATKIEP